MDHTVFFKNSTTEAPITGLSPVWSFLMNEAGAAYTPQPSITEVGNGYYKFTLAASVDLIGRVDGGAALAAADRYKEIAITAELSTNGGSAPATSPTDMTMQNVLDTVLSRLKGLDTVPGFDIFTAANKVINIITKRLITNDSDLVKAELTLSAIATTADYTMPTGFMGFVERPFISGTQQFLEPLFKEQRASLTTPGTPRYYRLRGVTLTLFPTPSANATILGDYWRRPNTLTALTDIVPFNGLIDHILDEAILQIGVKGMMLTVDPAFEAMLYKQLDEVLNFRAPKQVTWSTVTESSQRLNRGSHPDYFNM